MPRALRSSVAHSRAVSGRTRVGGERLVTWDLHRPRRAAESLLLRPLSQSPHPRRAPRIDTVANGRRGAARWVWSPSRPRAATRGHTRGEAASLLVTGSPRRAPASAHATPSADIGQVFEVLDDDAGKHARAGCSCEREPLEAWVAIRVAIGATEGGYARTAAESNSSKRATSGRVRTGADDPTRPFKEEVMGSNPIRATRPRGYWSSTRRAEVPGRFSAVEAASLQAASLRERRATR